MQITQCCCGEKWKSTGEVAKLALKITRIPDCTSMYSPFKQRLSYPIAKVGKQMKIGSADYRVDLEQSEDIELEGVNLCKMRDFFFL